MMNRLKWEILLLLWMAVLSGLKFQDVSARSWGSICKSGKLRVLTTDADRDNLSSGLHRIVMPIDREQALLRRFAKQYHLTIEYIYAPNFTLLFNMLTSDRGDLISANLSETPERQRKYLLSKPFDYTREIVFTASGSRIRGTTVNCLSGWTGWLLPGTSYVENFRIFSAGSKNITTHNFPKTITHDELIEQVASGKVDYSVLNEGDLDAWMAYRSGIRKLFPIRNQVPLVFAAGKNSAALIYRLNQCISGIADVETEKPAEAKTKTVKAKTKPTETVKSGKKKMTVPGKNVSSIKPGDGKLLNRKMLGDLPAIQKRGFIRMLTSNDVFCCYLKQGALCGFEYELASRFASEMNVMVVTVIPVKFKDLTRYLAEGKGDFIAAHFTCTPERIKKNPKLTFCAPYCGSPQVLVGRPGEKIRKIADLNGRRIFVRTGNTCYDTLKKLQAQGIRLIIVPIPENRSESHTIRMVESGKYDLTVADETFYQLAINSGSKVRKYLNLTEVQPLSWIVRKDNPRLAAAVNAFFKKENKSAFFNICKKRYFSPKQAPKLASAEFSKKSFRISPYDPIFKKYGQKYDFLWYFLAAQSYQESRFKTNLTNHLGATGLMQVTPKTAREIGISNLKNPDNGIHAGTRYMAKIRIRWPDTFQPLDRLCFSLAAYNAGYGHIQDARILAKKLGLNPNVWYQNTEKALALLEDTEYAAQAKYGFCRASETIPYVRNIMLQTYHYGKIIETKAPQTTKEKQKK